jgi:hypothetical protein
MITVELSNHLSTPLSTRMYFVMRWAKCLKAIEMHTINRCVYTYGMGRYQCK